MKMSKDTKYSEGEVLVCMFLAFLMGFAIHWLVF